ncbi:MAG: universal stress protein, partial [Methanothermobacter sp.]
EAEVLCLYVVDTSVPFLTPRKIKDMMAKELRQKGEQIIEEMKKGLNGPQNPNIKFRGVIREGDPAEEIVKFAEEENVDVIVLGTGKSLVDKHLLGSVSEKVVHYAPCTIHLVRTI